MPYRSDAQRKFFHAAAERGDISKKTVNEFDKSSKGMKLPKKIGAPKKPKIKSIAQLRSIAKMKGA